MVHCLSDESADPAEPTEPDGSTEPAETTETADTDVREKPRVDRIFRSTLDTAWCAA
jgi:hypothetical protein